MLYQGRLQWLGPVQDFGQTDNPYVVQFRTGSLSGPMQPAEI
jgi:phospholipid/cholesterol/gamma-HCH transport system ATP-binding protein